ncbi:MULTISPECIES: hypothetical protein [Zobellia]|uniref:hypothetical protein n=1 Tax=Zobellia TaxID=112040 RepID=UPI001BFFB829|nr:MULTISPECIES: hypothetical protein [Zobellia]MBT9189722.1 hypothetical protein [Zobellia russellii]MBU2973620.1 hypothetical protein [Zobellia sp. B3R18]MDO6820555.1 hypothetical protein [Zobellia sp. 1_MG-2023]
MVFTELNPKGNFDSWDKKKLKEIEEEKFSENIGDTLFENEELILTEIVLKPKERTPFRRHTNDYSCTCFTDGLMISRNINGQIALLRLEEGDHFYWACSGEEMVHDLENIGENTINIKILAVKK